METQVHGKSVFFSTGGAKFNNAERTIIFIHGAGMDPSTLVVSSAWANSGPVMKRYRPRAQGRAFSIKKQTCHISISVESAPTQTNAEVQN